MVLRMVTVVEQRLQAILEVVNQGRTVTEVAARYGCPVRRCTAGCAATRPTGSTAWRTGRTALRPALSDPGEGRGGAGGATTG